MELLFTCISKIIGNTSYPISMPSTRVMRWLCLLPDGEVLSGSINKSKMKLLLAWMEIHKDELIADWELAVSGELPYKIEPLR